MKHIFPYIKRYWVLVLATLLPIGVAIFALSFNTLSRYFVDLPKYNFLFALMPKYDQPIRYTVIQDKLYVILDKQFELKKLNKTLFPKLYLYDVKTQRSHELTYNIDPVIEKIRAAKQGEQKLDLLALQAFKLMGGREAPDRYRIMTFDTPYLFDNKVVIFSLFKKGHMVKVAYPEGSVDFDRRAAFVGWVKE